MTYINDVIEVNTIAAPIYKKYTFRLQAIAACVKNIAI